MILNTDGLKTVASECGSGFSEGLMYSKTFWESFWLWWFMHHHYSQDRILIVLRNHVVSLIFLGPAVAVYEADFKNIVFFKFTIPLLLFICTSLCFVSYILFKIQKWCEALVKFSEIYNFNFCIFLLMFLAYDVDVIAF